MTDRLKEIRERWEIPAGTSLDFELAMEDIEYLLSEIERKDEALIRLLKFEASCGENDIPDEDREFAKQALNQHGGGDA